MTLEQTLIDKLRRIEALFADTQYDGERVAAAEAMQRIRERLKHVKVSDPPVEFQFSMRDSWSRRLFVALLRRYDIKPYRLYRQRHTTVMARVPKRFLDETLWPEFTQLSDTLRSYLDEVTTRVISESIHNDASEAEVREEPRQLQT